jgi:hypothetical protein
MTETGIAMPAPTPMSAVPLAPPTSGAVSRDEDSERLPLHDLAAICADVIRLQAACYDKGERAQKARYVAQQPQAPSSRASFLSLTERHERDFATLLQDLQSAIAAGRHLWDEFVSTSGGESMDKLLMPLVKEGAVQGDEVSSIMVGGIFLKADFGSTIDSFFETDRKLGELMKSSMDGE